MKSAKRQKLANAGWKMGTAADFLGMSAQEKAITAMKLNLVRGIRALRALRHTTQVELASRLGSSQSRVAKIEAGDPKVSLDLLVRALFALGATQKQIAAMVGATSERSRPKSAA